MLSILIPVYNCDCRQLVKELCEQGTTEGVALEVLCFDDGSQDVWKKLNRELQELPQVHYTELQENIGRAAIRNALAKAAKFPWLLFLDGDVRPLRPDFISTYLECLKSGQVVVGGIAYSQEPPAARELFFRWYYGRQREQKNAPERQQRPWAAFLSGNFIVERDLFLAIGFDESLRQYGHEDTVFGGELARRKVPVNHCDNPVLHLGLEPVGVFLRKTDAAIKNLLKLYRAGKAPPTKLLRCWRQLRRWRMEGAFCFLFRGVQPLVEKQLQSKRPNLLLFDLYKLGRLCAANKRT